MKCKNCNHRICVQGAFKDQSVDHVNLGMGSVRKCPMCDCEKPKRKAEPIFCKNCNAEIHKSNRGYYKGEWRHIDTYDGRPGSAQRLGNITSLVTQCSKPEPCSR